MLLLTITERLARARSDLRLGLPVALTGDETALVAAVEALTPVRLEELRALGPLELALTARRAATLKARPYDGDIARIPVGNAPLSWLRAAADPAGDMALPLKGPFEALRGGDAAAHRAGVALAKSAQLLPAVVVVRAAAPDLLTSLPAVTALEEMARDHVMSPVVSARLPMVASEAGRVHIFRSDDDTAEHYAIEIGRPDRAKPVLARLHSACFTGDVLGSLKCDCGPQLRAALAEMGAQGEGVLLYLNQEGRGIGLANKMRAYALQDQGFDTVEANHRLGFEDDERDFRIGAGILRQMGFRAVKLLTNNPAKIDMMESHGVQVVERVPLKVGQTAQNAAYLATKAAKSGHLL
ncbi:GTP cyclohydrolase II [Falsirhodobacter deserti]|uniref:GTP cyclohydrolase II n=1 Tax=Falsirhodobacter deserti TaxID=1365611 RepID=UPI001F4E7415|nr:GTP cyclohydrolase II [Falsirhodobacter deserti]